VKMAYKAFYFAAALLALSLCAAASVVLNEVEVNPPEGGVNWVEIYNPDNESVDISGWTAEIVDGSWIGRFKAVPNGTVLAAGGFTSSTASPPGTTMTADMPCSTALPERRSTEAPAVWIP